MIANLAAWGVGFSMALAFCAAIDGSSGAAALCALLALVDGMIWWKERP